MSDDLISRIAESVQLQTLPQAIPPEYRPFWRICQVVLILSVCGRSGTCSRLHIHVISWGLNNVDTRKNILYLAKEQYSKMDAIAVRFDPALVRAVNLAAMMGLIESKGEDSLSITADGAKLAELVMTDPSLFRVERDILATIGKSLTKKNLKQYVEERVY